MKKMNITHLGTGVNKRIWRRKFSRSFSIWKKTDRISKVDVQIFLDTLPFSVFCVYNRKNSRRNWIKWEKSGDKLYCPKNNCPYGEMSPGTWSRLRHLIGCRINIIIPREDGCRGILAEANSRNFFLNFCNVDKNVLFLKPPRVESHF